MGVVVVSCVADFSKTEAVTGAKDADVTVPEPPLDIDNGGLNAVAAAPAPGHP